MPYEIGEEGTHDCSGFPVVNSDTGKVMGCHKTKEEAKKQLAALYIHVEDANKSADGFTPPQSVRDNAKRGLELRREFNRGGTEVGVARARSLSNGQSIPLETIRRMVSYFARHEVDKKGEDWGNASNPSAGYIAWLLWGGDAGKSWANGISEQEKKKDKSMTVDMTNTYASIIKQEKMEDGSLLVYGKATDDALDIDQQICDSAWLNKAMPEWFKTGGNIREQHSSIAAGVAKELDSKEDGHYITAHIVDPVSVKKIEAGVLKGFSIGIRSPRIIRDNKAANGRIIDGTIVEISVVDRPANPNAKLMLAKSDGTEMIEVEQELIEQEAPAVEEAVVETPAVEEAIIEEVAAEATEETAPIVEEEKEDEEEKVEEASDADAEKITAIFDKAKSLAGDVNKFDKGLFDSARTALAGLIAVEAKEMAEGHDERYSLSMLISAVHNLMCWFEGEEAEGEVVEEVEMAMTEGSEKSSTTILPRIGVDGQDLSDDGTEDEEDSVEQTDKSVITDEVVNAILEKAVKSAKESVSAEINSYQDEINALKGQLATALNKAVAGGPKRASTKASADNVVNDYVLRAIEMRNKAAGTTDRELAQGYRELAEDFEAKAKALTNK